MSENEVILGVNDAFYEAFSSCNLKAMEGIWAVATTICCIHPGWAPIFGRDAVIESWEKIFWGSETFDIFCNNAQEIIYGKVALVACQEVLSQGQLIASNLFVFENNVWRLSHHHAGPLGHFAPSPKASEATLH